MLLGRHLVYCQRGVASMSRGFWIVYYTLHRCQLSKGRSVMPELDQSSDVKPSVGDQSGVDNVLRNLSRQLPLAEFPLQIFI